MFSIFVAKTEFFCCALNFKVYIGFKDKFPHLVYFSHAKSLKSWFFAIFQIFDQKMCTSIRHGRYVTTIFLNLSLQSFESKKGEVVFMYEPLHFYIRFKLVNKTCIVVSSV